MSVRKHVLYFLGIKFLQTVEPSHPPGLLWLNVSLWGRPLDSSLRQLEILSTFQMLREEHQPIDGCQQIVWRRQTRWEIVFRRKDINTAIQDLPASLCLYVSH